MTYAQDQQRRQNTLTTERIVQIAKRNGSFWVSFRWRDDWLHRRCRALVDVHFFRRGKRDGKGMLYTMRPEMKDAEIKI